VALAVGVGGEVRAVDGDGLAHLGQLGCQGCDDLLDAGGQPPGVVAQLGGEAVAGVHGGGAAEDGLQSVVLSHQASGTGPGGQRVQRLHQRHAGHRPDGEAGTAGPTGQFQVSDEGRDLGRVEQGGQRRCVVTTE
jgi:hypothetical protein